MSTTVHPQSRPLRRRWFQFRLRTLLIAVAVLAVPCAWVGNQLNWIRQRQAVLALQPRRVFSTSWAAAGEAEAPGSLSLFGERGEALLFWHEDLPWDAEEAQRLFPEAKFMMVEDVNGNGAWRTVNPYRHDGLATKHQDPRP